MGVQVKRLSRGSKLGLVKLTIALEFALLGYGVHNAQILWSAAAAGGMHACCPSGTCENVAGMDHRLCLPKKD